LATMLAVPRKLADARGTATPDDAQRYAFGRFRKPLLYPVVHGLQVETFRITHGIPELKDIDDTGVLVDAIDDPVLRPPADAKEIGAIRRPREREVAPRQRRFSEIETQNAGEALDLLDGEVFAVVAEIGGKLINLAQCDRIDAHSESHRSLPLATAVDADESILESLRIVVDGLAGLDAGLGLFEGDRQFRALFVGKHRDFFHRGDRHHGGPAALVFGLGLARHGDTIAHQVGKSTDHSANSW
jgi:hypothetical protein